MRPRFRLPFRFFAAALAVFSMYAAVIDRVAIVIDKKVITESELLDDLRLTEFINGQPLDLGPLARREAAEHLVDQELVRRDMESGGFAKPGAAQERCAVTQIPPGTLPFAGRVPRRVTEIRSD